MSCNTLSSNKDEIDENDKTSNNPVKITVSNSGLTSGTTYYWKVIASDPKGSSAESETWSFAVE